MLTNLDLSCPQAEREDEQAVAEAVHQSVCEFFRRPHSSVIDSQFRNVSEKAARKMIAITCSRFLDLHCRELGNKFQSPVGVGVSNWGFEDIIRLAEYLNRRPLIKYSLEYFTPLKKDQENVDSDILKVFSNLTTSIQRYPSSLEVFLLEQLTNSSTDPQRVQELNCLLGYAAQKGYTVAVGNLLAAGAECSTALHRASWGGHQTTVRLLLDRGAKIEAKDPANQTPLHIASLCGHEATVRLLLDRGAYFKAEDYIGQTPLRGAAWGGYEAVVGLLGGRRADIDDRCPYKFTALHEVALREYGAMEMLRKRADDFEAKGSDKETPPRKAVRKGHGAAVGALLDQRADIEARDSGNQTPLHKAASGGHDVAVQLLLDQGADIEAKDSGNQTPLHKAASGGHEVAVQLLFDLGACIEAKDSGNQTPLHVAASGRHEATVRLLLDLGAYIEAEDSGNQTPLHIASSGGHEATVRLLLDLGADIEAKDSNNQTPLHIASSCGHAATMQLLFGRIKAKGSNN